MFANLDVTGQLRPTSTAPTRLSVGLPSLQVTTVTEPNDLDDQAVIEDLEDDDVGAEANTFWRDTARRAWAASRSIATQIRCCSFSHLDDAFAARRATSTA